MVCGGRVVREYAAGSLWVWPAFWAILALIAGALLSAVSVAPGSFLAIFAFQGTSDDARTLLTTIAGTVVTVIALVLGLTVVALQLSSTQFSPRLLSNFLRDHATQRVLSVFLSTFTYSTAGLYTVGVSAGNRTEVFPRLAVSGAILLLFVTLAMVVYFADHLAHSIQIDAIADVVQRNTLEAVRHKPGTSEGPRPQAPDGAVAIPAHRSGYVRAVYPASLAQVAARGDLTVLLTRMVGEHVVVGTDLARVWSRSAQASPIIGTRTRARTSLRGPHRLRADTGTRRGLRYPAVGRHGLQGTVAGGQRSLHRCAGRRSSLGDLPGDGCASTRGHGGSRRVGDGAGDRSSPALR